MKPWWQQQLRNLQHNLQSDAASESDAGTSAEADDYAVSSQQTPVATADGINGSLSVAINQDGNRHADWLQHVQGTDGDLTEPQTLEETGSFSTVDAGDTSSAQDVLQPTEAVGLATDADTESPEVLQVLHLSLSWACKARCCLHCHCHDMHCTLELKPSCNLLLYVHGADISTQLS